MLNPRIQGVRKTQVAHLSRTMYVRDFLLRMAGNQGLDRNYLMASVDAGKIGGGATTEYVRDQETRTIDIRRTNYEVHREGRLEAGANPSIFIHITISELNISSMRFLVTSHLRRDGSRCR